MIAALKAMVALVVVVVGFVHLVVVFGVVVGGAGGATRPVGRPMFADTANNRGARDRAVSPWSVTAKSLHVIVPMM